MSKITVPFLLGLTIFFLIGWGYWCWWIWWC